MTSLIYRYSLGLKNISRSTYLRRGFGNINVPFQDDLSAANDEDFNLQDFQHYQESADIISHRNELLGGLDDETTISKKAQDDGQSNSITTNELTEYAQLKEPIIFVSKLSSPYKNLAIEDYIFQNMPIPEKNSDGYNYNRLMFYTNSPCVVIGKNQNPWKEVNIPLLNSLQIPLIRRRSGGGTVVHDLGNVNYSYMTTKAKFDRFKFANIIKHSINNFSDSKFTLDVNDRGDITTTKLDDGINYKISGSAYKLARGKSYHHGTMLLNLRLDILKQLLHRDDAKLGVVDAMSSINSVKSKVINLELSNEKFVELVTEGFQKEYGVIEDTNEIDRSEDIDKNEEYDQNELFGLTDFVEANSNIPRNRSTKVIYIDDSTKLPSAILETEDELKKWEWKFGGTPKFSHELTNDKLNFKIKFMVDKHAIVRSFDISFSEGTKILSEQKIIESFDFLKQMIDKGDFKYKGSEISGFITNDMISDWIGECIDGTN